MKNTLWVHNKGTWLDKDIETDSLKDTLNGTDSLDDHTTSKTGKY